jgi:hypothetical protein
MGIGEDEDAADAEVLQVHADFARHPDSEADGRDGHLESGFPVHGRHYPRVTKIRVPTARLHPAVLEAKLRDRVPGYNSPLTIALGTQLYEGGADAGRRQQRAVDALVRIRGVTGLNLQWIDEVHEHPALETVAVLRQDSRTITGLPVRRKPIMPELFDALADAASFRACRYFGFFNADIVVTQAAIDAIEREGKETYGFSRMDFDETGRDLGLMPDGLDMFVFTVDWWRRERRRFRAYVLAEWFYDPVFGAILMCHGDGLILNRNGEIRHEAHPQAPSQGPMSRYNGYLAALDSRYFSLWARYRHRLDEARAQGASDADERAIQRDVFVWRPSLAAALWQTGRSVKATWRYRRLRAAAARELIP